MNLRSFILGTVATNLALVGALLWQTAQIPAPGQRGGVSITTNVVNEVVNEASPRPAVVNVPGSPPFHWNQLEHTNHLRFLTNLLAIGCPPETARDILEARVADDFRARWRELVRPLQPRFWDAAADGKLEKLSEGTETETAMERLKEERRRVEKELHAAIPPAQKADRPSHNEQVAHLAADKQAELRRLESRHAQERETLKRELAKAPAAERQGKQNELNERQQSERRAVYTETEWAEAELRRSPQARQVRELRGYAAAPEELRALAAGLRDFYAMNPLEPPRDRTRSEEDDDYRARVAAREAKRKDFLTQRLGEAGFLALERGRDAQFHTLLKLARRLDLPPDHAVQWLTLQTTAQAQIRATSQNAELAASARALAIAAIQAETKLTLQAAVGERGWGAYQRHAAGWLKP